jgi:AbrB family looped-hinge helix DNA binding protein
MTVTLKPKTEITVPRSIRRKAGIKPGDRVEFTVSGSVINIVPKLPYAEDTFSPDETAQIVKARQEMREGKYVTLTDLEHDLAHKTSTATPQNNLTRYRPTAASAF